MSSNTSKSEANSPSAWYLNLTSTSPDGIGTRFSEKFHVIWNSPGCWDQLESLRVHEEIGVKLPLDSADLISRKRVPFIGSGVSPLLSADPLMLTSSLMPRRLEFAYPPSKVRTRSGASVTFIWKSMPIGLTCAAAVDGGRPSSLHPGNQILASRGPSGSFSPIVMGNWKKPRSETLVEMLTAPSVTVVYSRKISKAGVPLESSSRSLGSERSGFSHMKVPSRSVVTPAPTDGSSIGWGSEIVMEGSSVRFSPQASAGDCANPVSLVITR